MNPVNRRRVADAPQQVSFAQRRADSVVQKLETAEELDEHLKRRKDEKSGLWKTVQVIHC